MPILCSIPLRPFPLTNPAVGSVYTGGILTAGGTTERYTTGGTKELFWNNGATVNDIWVSPDNLVYTVGASDGTFTTKKSNADGQIVWGVNHGATVNGIDVHSDGRVATGGASGTGGFTTRVYDNNGTLLWSVNHGATVNSVAFDIDGSLYTGGAPGTGGFTLRKYNTSGTLLWSVNTSREIFSLDFSPKAFDNSIVVGMIGTGADFQVKQYDTSGSYIVGWNYSGFINTTTATGVYCPKTTITRAGFTVDAIVCYKIFNSTTNLYNGGVVFWNNIAGNFATYTTQNQLTDVVIDNLGNIYSISDDSNGNIFKNPDNIPTVGWSITRGAQGFCIDVNNKG
jgi:hypothetical protein